MEKMDENRSFVTIIAHFFLFRSLLVSFGGSKVWPGGLLQATVVEIYCMQLDIQPLLL